MRLLLSGKSDGGSPLHLRIATPSSGNVVPMVSSNHPEGLKMSSRSA